MTNKKKSPILEYIAIASVPLIMVLGNSMLIPILPKMKSELNLTQFEVSLVITLFSVTAGIIIPFSGYLSDRLGRKAVIITSLALYGAGGIVAGLAAAFMGETGYLVILAGRALQGLGAAGTAPIAMALVGDLYKGATESKILGLTEASNGTGKVLSPIIGSLLALIVWYAAFFAFPIFCLLSILAVMFFIKEPKMKKKPPAISKYMKEIKTIFKKKGRWLIACFFVGSLALFILFGVLFYLSDILETKYKVDGVKKGFILAIPLLGMVVTSYTTGTKIKKNGKLMRSLMLIGLAMMAITLGATTFAFKSLYLFIGLLTLSSIGTGLILPCLNSIIIGAIQKEQRGMITSLYGSVRFLGVAAGPPIFGWLMAISERILFISVSSLALLTLAITFFFIKPDEKVN
jgi:ACDE family multidrug resistance protein